MRLLWARGWTILTIGCAGGGSAPLEPPDASAPTARGDLEIITTRTGPRVEPDGGVLTLNGGTYALMGSSDTVRIRSVPVAVYQIGLAGAASACKVGGGNPRGIRVEHDATTRVVFVLKCALEREPGDPLTS